MAEISIFSDVPKQLPSIIGPNIYELYTDAKYFITHVFVNGMKRKLSNAEGGGMMSRKGYSFEGAMGYENKLLLNGYMKAGKNEIKVVFEPSGILQQAREQGAEKMIMGDMYGHVVITQGELNEGSFGVESYDLDQLIVTPERKAKVLTDQLLRRFNDEKLEAEVSVTFSIDVSDTDKALKASYGSLSINSSCNYTATLLLNDVPVKKIEDNSSSTLEEFFDVVKTGVNRLTLQVESINKKEDENTLYLYLESDIKSLFNEIGFPDGYSASDFGDFFSTVYVPITTFDFPEEGSYTSDFNFEV